MPDSTPQPILSDADIDRLSRLSHDRFALQTADYLRIYPAILATFSVNARDKHWHLIGTDGCHLCADSEQLIYQTLQMLGSDISLTMLELTDTSDARLIDALGMSIPVLLTPQKLLAFPFGVMDIVALDD